MRRLLLVAFGMINPLLLTACMQDTSDRAAFGPDSEIPQDSATVPGVAPEIRPLPKGFPQFTIPEDNPLTSDKAYLGRHLFYDKRLSLDSTLSCATCHKQEFGFSDAGVRLSPGVSNAVGKRNTPGLANVVYNRAFFFEGGVPSLELQAIAPIINPKEMRMHTDTLVARLRDDTLYARLFVLAWGSREININRITHSISAFERTLVSGNSAYDKFKNGNNKSMDASAKRGLELFFGEKGDCFHCHNGYNLTDNLFHNNGLDSTTFDEGRFGVTGLESDKGKFKTPSLRNVALTPPYMHDGRFSNLDEVLDHYNAGGKRHPNASALMRPLGLSAQDKMDIVAFLKSLTDSTFITDDRLANPWPH